MRIIVLFFCLSALSACSSKLAYNHLDWLILWYSDDYLNLNRDQEAILEKEVESFLKWHRTEELHIYKRHLEAIRDDLHITPIAKENIHSHLDHIQYHWRRARQQMSLQLAPLSQHLTHAQIEHLFAELEEKNDEKLEAFSDHTDTERRQDFFDRWLESLEDVFSELTDTQLSLLENHALNHRFLTHKRVIYLQTYQARLKYAMLNHSSERIDTVLQLLNSPEQFQSNEYQTQVTSNRANLVNFLHQLSQTLTQDQKEHARRYITEYIDLINEILSESEA